MRHHVQHRAKGPRYLEMAEGYVTRSPSTRTMRSSATNSSSLGKMMEPIKKGVDADEA